jgi:glycerate 2-kinase
MPQADGGEGTLDAIATSGSWHRRVTEVAGPDGRPVHARWLLDDNGRAVVELAESSGIALMPHLDPWHASTHGLGEVIAAALSAGARSVQVDWAGPPVWTADSAC